MSFLDKNNSEYLSARLTQEGRKAIAKGDFKISYFSIGDSEINYGTSGSFSSIEQNVLAPLDRDSDIKYPILYQAESDTTYGIPITGSTTETVRNIIGPAGFVSGSVFTVGTLVATGSFSALTGTTGITVNIPTGTTFGNSNTISLVLTGTNGTTITGNTNSFVYKLVSVSGLTSTSEFLTLDRNTPDLSTLSGKFFIVDNNANNEFPSGSDVDNTCLPILPDNTAQHDSWTLNTVWSKKPIGFTSYNDNVTVFNSSKYLSTKEFLGYHSDEGQLFYSGSNIEITGTTYVNVFDEKIEVLPSEQSCISLIHYSEIGDIINDPDRFYKYDDYISIETTGTNNDLTYFEVYIPFMDYHRNTGTTIGAKFSLGTTTKHIQSLINPLSNIPYRDLLDEQGNTVGKVFTDKKVIIFDDQEIVAVLDYKSNRKFTLPTPKLELTHSDNNGYIFNGTTGETLYISYAFSYTDDKYLNGLPCMNFAKITSTNSTNVVLKFTGSTSFDFLKTSINDLKTGIVANTFYVLAQKTTNNQLPTETGWKVIDKTPSLSGGFIPASGLTGATITISGDDYDTSAMYFTLTNHMNIGNGFTGSTNFGDEQYFPGSVKLVRATDIEEMNFLVNLPDGKFATSQNPTYTSGNPKITEVSLLNSNKKVMVMAKTASPIERTGSQVFAVKLDF